LFKLFVICSGCYQRFGTWRRWRIWNASAQWKHKCRVYNCQ